MRLLRGRSWITQTAVAATLLILFGATWIQYGTSSQPATSYVLAANTSQEPYPTQADVPNINIISSLINSERSSQGLRPLIKDTVLTDIAETRAADMAARGYYAHRNPDGLYFYDQLDQRGYAVAYGCENLDLEFELLPETYINAWMSSTSGHRECLLNPRITNAGYAAVKLPPSGSKGTIVPAYIVVAIYANPK